MGLQLPRDNVHGARTLTRLPCSSVLCPSLCVMNILVNSFRPPGLLPLIVPKHVAIIFAWFPVGATFTSKVRQLMFCPHSRDFSAQHRCGRNKLLLERPSVRGVTLGHTSFAKCAVITRESQVGCVIRNDTESLNYGEKVIATI